ncbi:MAG: SBBP repeat-containing protein [Bacteroidales bacterium]
MAQKLRSLLIFLILPLASLFIPSLKAIPPQQGHTNSHSIPEFIANLGQIADQSGNINTDVLFLAAVPFGNITINKNGISYTFISHDDMQHHGVCLPGSPRMTGMEQLEPDQKPLSVNYYRVDMQLLGANHNPEVVTFEESDDHTHYYLAHCPEGITHVKKYRTIRMKDVYEGIDFVVYGTYDNRIQYDFIIHPGADPSHIRFRFEGIEAVHVSADGRLICSTPFGNIEQGRPIAWQADQPGRYINSRDLGDITKYSGTSRCEAGFVVNADQSVTFTVGRYDPEKTLVLDPPTRLWGTYYGGNSGDDGAAVATDGDGNVYLAGSTYSQINQTIATTGAHQATYGGDNSISGGDAYLVKFNSQGVRQWSTYYGGAGPDGASSLALDAEGNIFMAGGTISPSAIATSGVHKNYLSSLSFQDAFLVKFNSSGVRIWGTYLGGPGHDGSVEVLADADGNAYLIGWAESATGIATTGAHQGTFAGGDLDGFLVKFDSQGGRIWGTYFGGSENDLNASAAMDASGHIYIAGYTWSDSGIATSGSHQAVFGGTRDGFMAKFNDQGTLLWSTYYGGDQVDECRAMAIDPSGHIYIGGFTLSTTGIATAGSHQPAFGGPGSDCFIARFNSSGTRLWGTYFGGTGYDDVRALATDQENSVYPGGTTETTSGTGIATPGSHQPSFGGHYADAFLAKFTANGFREWGTYYGGMSVELGSAVAVDPQGNVYLAGHTASSTGIATPGSHQPQFGGYEYCLGDAYLVKFQATHIGITETADHSPLRAYPNPTQGDVRIYGKTPLLNLPYTIRNLAGQVVLSGIITAEAQTVPLGTLQSGCYFIRIDDLNIIRIIRY